MHLTQKSHAEGRQLVADRVRSVERSARPSVERANKNFDLLYLPNRTHAFFRGDTYYVRRMWDYFVEHLGGVRPPEGYDLNSATAAMLRQ